MMTIKYGLHFFFFELTDNDGQNFLAGIVSGVQMKSWAGEALETVNCCAFLKRRLIGAC
jgi:hypothetical protein